MRDKTHLKVYFLSGITAFIVILAATVFYFFLQDFNLILAQLSFIAHILRPIFMGLIIAFLLLPVHKRVYSMLCDRLLYDKKGQKRKVSGLLKGLSIAITMVFTLLLLYFLLAMVIPQVYLSIVGLVKSIPDYIETAETWIMGFLEDNPDIQQTFLAIFNPAAVSVEEWLNDKIIPNLDSVSKTLQWFKETLLPNITGVISNVSSLVIQILMVFKDLFIGIIVAIYLLASKDVFAAQSKKIVYSVTGPKIGDLIVEETRNAYRIMSGFINGKLLDSLIIGFITLFFCNIFQFPYAALIAMIIGVTNIIPFFGPFIGAIPSAFLILLVDPMKFLYFCLFVFILQQFDGNILGPKILGESTGLASFWVLFSIILSGGLFGFAGMVLGVPCFAILYSVLRRLVNRGLRKKHLPVDTADYIGPTGKLSSADASTKTE